MKHAASLFIMVAVCLSLSACDVTQDSSLAQTQTLLGESTPPLASSIEAAESEATRDRLRLYRSVVLETPAESEDVITEINRLGANGILLTNNTVESSGNSLTVVVDETFPAIIAKFLQEPREKTSAPESMTYTEFIRIHPSESENWRILLFREESSNVCYLSLVGVDGVDAVYYAIADTAFDDFQDEINAQLVMLDAPADEFLEPVREVVANYRSGAYDSEDYAAIFSPPPDGAVIRAVNNVEDFTVAPGDQLAAYRVIIPTEGVNYAMVLSMIQTYPSSGQHQDPHWRVMSVTFVSSDSDGEEK